VPRIFHLATEADWRAAQASGSYTTSTRGRTLAEEGFIHASRGDQWQGVRERYYADVAEPLVLLSIDTAVLTSPVLDEAVPGTDETYPHIFGPIDVAAVVAVIPLDAEGTPGRAEPAATSASFSRLFLEEVFRQLALAALLLGCVVALTLVGLGTGLEWGPVTGAAVGLALGVVAVRRLSRRRG
jgi:uncharacterized protein (DUF952 family)